MRDAFTAKGHDVTSCDILPTERPGKHYQGDVRDILGDGWDMMIAHPPCTYLASSGAQYWPKRAREQYEALLFVKLLANYGIERIAIENPAGILSTKWRKPEQYINPYQFGEPYRKRTGLWLKNLPLLKPTSIVEPVASWHSGSTRGGKKKDGTRTKSTLPALKSGWKERSRTFTGIAQAMAEQWG